jgi:hypothetical protein
VMAQLVASASHRLRRFGDAGVGASSACVPGLHLTCVYLLLHRIERRSPAPDPHEEAEVLAHGLPAVGFKAPFDSPRGAYALISNKLNRKRIFR